MGTADVNPERAIVAIAAESREFDGLLRHATQQRPLAGPIVFAREAEVDGVRWILAANGPGARLAAEAVRFALSAAAPRALVSTGFCGSLEPDWPEGDIVVATEVRSREGSWPASAPDSTMPYRKGAVVSGDRVAATSAEKADLKREGASAVEMEAAVVAQSASSAGVPFYCIRAVSDTATGDMPLDFNEYRDAEGRFDRSRIAGAALLRPGAIAGLMRLDAACRRASRNLGDFLAHCRF